MDKNLHHISDLMDGALEVIRKRAARAASLEGAAPARTRTAPASPDASPMAHQKGQPVHFAPERT